VGACGGSVHEEDGEAGREKILRLLNKSGNGEEWMRRLQEKRDRESGRREGEREGRRE